MFMFSPIILIFLILNLNVYSWLFRVSSSICKFPVMAIELRGLRGPRFRLHAPYLTFSSSCFDTYSVKTFPEVKSAAGQLNSSLRLCVVIRA